MAKTPYKSLGSEDILSAHLNGVQYSIGNIEGVLDLKTKAMSGHILNPVDDMTDPTLRYRIYEASERGWLDDPAPVIYRNGAEVDPSEYTLQPAYGVVVFIAQQNADAFITADFTHVYGDSERLEIIERDINDVEGRVATAEGKVTTVQNSVNGLSDDVSTLQSDVTGLNQRVTTLETTGGGDNGGDGGGISFNAYPVLTAKGGYISNGFGYMGDLPSKKISVFSGNNIEAFPVVITEVTTIDEMMVLPAVDNGKQAWVICAIYSDNGNVYPDKLLAQTDRFRNNLEHNGTQVSAPLRSPITLPPAVYWFARYTNDGVAYDGWSADNCTSINPPYDAPVNGSSGRVFGVRSTVGADFPDLSGWNMYEMPPTFPELKTIDSNTYTNYLCRTDNATVFAKTVK